MYVKTVVAVPGPWTDLPGVERAVMGVELEATEGEGPELDSLRVEWVPADATLAAAVLAGAAPNAFTVPEAAALSGARGCVFVVDKAGGSVATVQRMMRLVGGLLQAGGLAAKVESSGRSHGPARWCRLDPDKIDDRMYAFVTLVGSGATGFGSCGMHNLGLPDATLPAATAPSEVGALLSAFNLIQLELRPEAPATAPWSASIGGRRFRVEHAASRYASGTLHHNPFGEWRLQPE